MKYISALLILLSGCSYSTRTGEKIEGVDFPTLPPHVIEINEIPHPFNLNNTNQYVVWVNGKRVGMKPEAKSSLIALVGARNIAPVSDEDIHNGDGWLRPLYPDREAFELALINKEEKEEEDVGRTN